MKWVLFRSRSLSVLHAIWKVYKFVFYVVKESNKKITQIMKFRINTSLKSQ